MNNLGKLTGVFVAGLCIGGILMRGYLNSRLDKSAFDFDDDEDYDDFYDDDVADSFDDI